MSGITRGDPYDQDTYYRPSASTYHSSSSYRSEPQHDAPDESSNHSNSQSSNQFYHGQQIQCFACLRMNDPALMQPHKFVHRSYFINAATHEKSLCVACYQTMGMDESVNQLANQSNSDVVRPCVWEVDKTDSHYPQCSGCGEPNRKNNLCEICPRMFCDACIRSFGGSQLWRKVENDDCWQCLAHARSSEWTNDCDLFTVPHVRCRAERGEFTPKTAINPLFDQSNNQSTNLSINQSTNQLQSLSMVAGLTYHTPLVKKRLSSHIDDVTELVNLLVDETKKQLSKNAASIKYLKSVPSDQSISRPTNQSNNQSNNQPSPAITVSRPLKLISVSLYHKTGCRPDEHRRYLVGLMENLQTFTSIWPGWTLRIYYDSSMLVPASSPLDDQENVASQDRVIENDQGILTLASNPNVFVWDHSKYTSHLVTAWQTFMSWARDQPHIQLCYFNWPHLQDAEGFHLRHVGMLARFLALAEIGVTSTHVVIADLDNLWRAEARDKAENFEPQTARFHRFKDLSYPWKLMGGGFSVRWPDDEMTPTEPEKSPFHDIEYEMHQFAQDHFSRPHEFYSQYRERIQESSRPVGKAKHGNDKGNRDATYVKQSKSKLNLHDDDVVLIDNDFDSDNMECDGVMKDELFGYCVDQAFLASCVWERMMQFDREVVLPGWISTTFSKIKNVPQFPNLPERTLLEQQQNPFDLFFDMLRVSKEWPACYQFDDFPQYKLDDGALSWKSRLISVWMKKKCSDITLKQTKKNWCETPIDAKDVSAPLHYYSKVVDSRVRMVNSLIDYLGRLTTDSSRQQHTHHPFIGLPSLSSSRAHDDHSKRFQPPDKAGHLPKHDWIVSMVHDFMELKRSAVQKAMLLHETIHQTIMGGLIYDTESQTTAVSSSYPVFHALSSSNQSLNQSNNNTDHLDESQTESRFIYDVNDDDDDSNEYEQSINQTINQTINPSINQQSSSPRTRHRISRSGSPHVKRFKQLHQSHVPIIDLIDSDCDDPPIVSSTISEDRGYYYQSTPNALDSSYDSDDGYSHHVTSFDRAELIIDLTGS